MTFYTDLRDNDAGPLISEFGQTVTLRQIAQSYSPTTGIGTRSMRAGSVQASPR